MKTGTVIFLAVHVALVAVILTSWLGSEFELQWLYPFALLFTSYREETLAAWQKYGQVNTNIIRPPSPIPEILAKDYNYEVLKAASNNFRHAVVVRGLFANTTALEKWKTEDYLPTKLGGHTIPIVRNAVVGTLQDDRVLVDFEPSFRELFRVNYTRQYLFFPVKSRFTFNGSDAGRAAQLQEACDKLCIEDLDLNRIWHGFATKRHTSFAGSQFVIGKSTDTFTNKSTGSDWHCAAGNNWFVQAAGRKRWDFVEPKYSAWMTPLKGGFFNMWTGNKNIASIQKHIPTKFTILEEGDLLYNPDWQWHKVTNYGGLSIGVPIRERNFTLMFQNNPYFSSIVALNTALNKLTGLDLGGFPPPSAATEADNF